jgi:hypothetical protein
MVEAACCPDWAECLDEGEVEEEKGQRGDGEGGEEVAEQFGDFEGWYAAQKAAQEQALKEAEEELARVRGAVEVRRCKREGGMGDGGGGVIWSVGRYEHSSSASYLLLCHVSTGAGAAACGADGAGLPAA